MVADERQRRSSSVRMLRVREYISSGDMLVAAWGILLMRDLVSTDVWVVVRKRCQNLLRIGSLLSI